MLKSLWLRDFKSFRDVRVPLGPITLLVGTNASGKSNVRDALRLLDGVGHGFSLADIIGDKWLDGVLQWRGIRGGAREIARQGTSAFTISVELDDVATTGQLLAPSATYSLTVDVSRSAVGPRVLGESLHVGSAMVFDSNPPDDPVTQDGPGTLKVRLPRGGSHRGHGPLVTCIPTTPALSQVSSAQEPRPPLRDQALAVRRALRALRFLDLSPNALRTPSNPGQSELGDHGENLSSVLMKICDDVSRKQVLLEWIRALTPMDATDLTFPEDHAGRVLVHLGEAGREPISANSASDGTLRFLAMAALLMPSDAQRTYFLEELDNGLHPTRLHLLLELVRSACDRRQAQVIGTTHVPTLLAYLDEQARADALLVFRNEPGGESRVLRILEIPGAREVIESNDLGELLASGWLENAAAFASGDEGTRVAEPGP